MSRFYGKLSLLTGSVKVIGQAWWRSSEMVSVRENDGEKYSFKNSFADTPSMLSTAVICVIKLAPYLG